MIHDPWTAAADRVLARVEGKTDRDAEEVLGISFSTIHRWRELRKAGKGIPEPRGNPRRVLERVVTPGAEGEAGEERPEDAVAGGGAAEQIEEVLEREGIIRTLKTAGTPGDALLRKRAILAGYRQVLTIFGPVPDWFLELEQRVERGEV